MSSQAHRADRIKEIHDIVYDKELVRLKNIEQSHHNQQQNVISLFSEIPDVKNTTETNKVRAENRSR